MKKTLLALAIFATIVGNVSAGIKYWDIDGATPGAGGAGIPTGTWNTTTANWSLDSTGSSATTTWSDFDDAVFSAGADGTGTFTVTSPVAPGINVKSITVEEGTVTNGAGVVNFGANNGQFTVADGAIWTTSGAGTGLMNGTAGITMGLPATTGTGVLRLGSTSGGLTNASGPIVTINSGVVEITGDGGLGATPAAVKPNALVINNGAIFRYARATNAVGEITVNRGVTLGGGNAFIDVAISGTATVANSPFLIDSKISAPAGTTLTKTGNGELRLNPNSGTTANDFEKLVVLGGSVRFGQATGLGQDTQLGLVPSSPLADAITLDNGTLGFLGGGGTLGDNITLNANRGITLGSTGGTLEAFTANGIIPGKITGTGILTKTGTLTVTLTNGANDYSGGFTNVNAGLLRANNTSGSATGTSQVLVNTGGSLGGNGIITGLISIQSGGRIVAGTGLSNEDLDTDTVTLNSGGIIDSLVGASGNDVLKVNATNGLTIFGGLLNIGATAATGSPAGHTYTLVDYNGAIGGDFSQLIVNNATGFDVTVNNNLTTTAIEVTISNTAQDKTWTVDADGNWSPNAVDANNWTSPGQPNGPGAAARFLGAATTPHTVTLNTASAAVGTLVFDNANTYTIAATGTNRLVMNTYSGNATINVVSGSHKITAPMTVTAATTMNVPTGLQLSTAGLSNAGGITKTGAGTWMITAADATGTGAINLNEGKLLYETNATGLSSGSLITIASGATLDMGGPTGTTPINDTFGDLAGDGSVVNVNGNTGTTPGLQLAGGRNTVFNGTISGTSFFRISKTVGSSLTLTKANTYGNTTIGTLGTSGTIINSGTLLASNDPLLPGSATGAGPVTVNNTGTLGGTGRVSGAITVASGGTIAPGASVGTLTTDGNVTLNGGSRLSFELATPAASDKLVVGGTLALPTTAVTETINLVNAGSMTAGIFPLIDYATLTGNFSTLVLGTQPAGFTYSLVNDAIGTVINLQVTALGLPGDFNGDGKVDAADYVNWREYLGTNNNLSGNGDETGGSAGIVDGADYALWKSRFGNTAGAGSGTGLNAVPEPGAIVLLLAGLVAAVSARNRRK